MSDAEIQVLAPGSTGGSRDTVQTMKLRLTATILVALGATACSEGPSPAAQIDTSFVLRDESGEVVSSTDFDGRIRLVFFGFASCPDICPITLNNIAAALRLLGPRAEDVAVLFISVDPKRDSPEVLARYTDSFHPSIVGLTGTYEQLLEVTQAYRTTFGHTVSRDGAEHALNREAYEAAEPGDDYVPFHSSQVYLLGRDGELLDVIGYGSKPSDIAASLEQAIGEG